MTQKAPAIADKNLRLALLDEIQENYYWIDGLCMAYEAARSQHPEWQSWSSIKDNEDDSNPALEAYLLTLEVTCERLGQVTGRYISGWVGKCGSTMTTCS